MVWPPVIARRRPHLGMAQQPGDHRQVGPTVEQSGSHGASAVVGAEGRDRRSPCQDLQTQINGVRRQPAQPGVDPAVLAYARPGAARARRLGPPARPLRQPPRPRGGRPGAGDPPCRAVRPARARRAASPPRQGQPARRGAGQPRPGWQASPHRGVGTGCHAPPGLQTEPEAPPRGPSGLPAAQWPAPSAAPPVPPRPGPGASSPDNHPERTTPRAAARWRLHRGRCPTLRHGRPDCHRRAIVEALPAEQGGVPGRAGHLEAGLLGQLGRHLDEGPERALHRAARRRGARARRGRWRPADGAGGVTAGVAMRQESHGAVTTSRRASNELLSRPAAS